MTDNPVLGPLTIGHIIAISGIIVGLLTTTITSILGYVKKRRELKKSIFKMNEPYGFWHFLLNNPSRGTAREGIRLDIVSQRKHIREVLSNLEELERSMGCGDSELNLDAREITDDDLSNSRAKVMWLERNHHRNSHWYNQGPWVEYFKKSRIAINE